MPRPKKFPALLQQQNGTSFRRPACAGSHRAPWLVYPNPRSRGL